MTQKHLAAVKTSRSRKKPRKSRRSRRSTNLRRRRTKNRRNEENIRAVHAVLLQPPTTVDGWRKTSTRAHRRHVFKPPNARTGCQPTTSSSQRSPRKRRKASPQWRKLLMWLTIQRHPHVSSILTSRQGKAVFRLSSDRKTMTTTMGRLESTTSRAHPETGGSQDLKRLEGVSVVADPDLDHARRRGAQLHHLRRK